MKPRATKEVIQALAVVCELTRTHLSEAAARVFAEDLARYPVDQVLGALVKCRREVRSNLTPADVIARLDDGRPGPEQAWAMAPKSEAESAVLTKEMMQALAVANPLLIEGDAVAGRMAFVETYRKLVMEARDRGEPTEWFPSLGTDASHRDGVLLDAKHLGRLPNTHVDRLLSDRDQASEDVLVLASSTVRQIEG